MGCPSSIRCLSSLAFYIFNFSSETAERNLMKLQRKQDLYVLYQVCVFRADQKKNKMAALASDWLRHFRLLLWNRCTEFNETCQEARSQSPLPNLSFSGWSVNKNGGPGQFVNKVAYCTQVHVMWPFWPLVRQYPCRMNTEITVDKRGSQSYASFVLQENLLMAYQISFDMYDSATQQFLQRVQNALRVTVPLPEADGKKDETDSVPVQCTDDKADRYSHDQHVHYIIWYKNSTFISFSSIIKENLKMFLPWPWFLRQLDTSFMTFGCTAVNTYKFSNITP